MRDRKTILEVRCDLASPYFLTRSTTRFNDEPIYYKVEYEKSGNEENGYSFFLTSVYSKRNIKFCFII